MGKGPAWLRVDPSTEMADAMTMAIEFAVSARTRRYAWKWEVLAVHSATQLALAFAARHAKWEKVPEEGKSPRMHPFAVLLARYKNVLDDETIAAATRLNKLRDEFAHFKFDGWSLGVEYVRLACLGSLPVIEQLLMQNERKVLFFPSMTAEQRVARKLRSLRRELTAGYSSPK